MDRIECTHNKRFSLVLHVIPVLKYVQNKFFIHINTFDSVRYLIEHLSGLCVNQFVCLVGTALLHNSSLTLTAPTIQNFSGNQMEKVCSQKRDIAFTSSPATELAMCHGSFQNPYFQQTFDRGNRDLFFRGLFRNTLGVFQCVRTQRSGGNRSGKDYSPIQNREKYYSFSTTK